MFSFIIVASMFIIVASIIVASMLVTDVGDEMCWRRLWDAGDGFGRFRHQHPLSRALTSKRCHQHKVTNINLSSRSNEDRQIEPNCLDKIGCNLTQLQNIIATKSQGGSWSFAEKDDYKNFQPIGKWTSISFFQ